MDSLAWSKKYQVLSFSRLILSSLGFTTEQINILTDEDMRTMEEAIRVAVDEAIDEVTSGKGVRALTELERKPILRGF